MSIPTQSGINGRIDVHFEGNIAIITLKRNENKMNDSFFDEIDKALDQVESNRDAKVLITTGEGKYFSIGLDLDWLKPTQATTNYGPTFFEKWRQMTRRFLTFPMPTVAALNGHAYAGGAFLALCHDYRIMNSDRGWFCLNEVHIGMLFPPIFVELIRMKIGFGQNYNEMAVLGRRYTAKEALENGFIQKMARSKDIMQDARKMAISAISQGAYNRQTLKDMKELLYKPILDVNDWNISKL